MNNKIKSVLSPISSIVLAVILGSIIILLIGESPGNTFSIMLQGAFGSNVNLANTLLKATTLTFSGLSYAYAYKCGLINIGAEGQIYIGALFATLVALFMPGPGWLVILVALVAGFLGGGIWGILTGILKVSFGANEVILTVMLNYVAQYIVQYMVCGPIQDPNNKAGQTILFDQRVWLPTILPGTTLHIGVFIVVICAVFYGFFLMKTIPGFEMQIVGHNKNAAAYSGIDVKKNTILAMFVAGGFAGLGGAIEVLGVQHRLLNKMASNYGFDGIAVALLGSNAPVGMLFSGVLLGALKSGGTSIQMFTKVPSAVVDLIRAFVILFVLINVMGRIWNRIEKSRKKESA